MHMKRAALIALIGLAALGGAYGQSKYARINKGVGNVLIGEVLPYNDDYGYQNVVLGSVNLSDMADWESLYFRAYFAKKIGDIRHDCRVLIMHLDAEGGQVEKFRAESGGALFTMTYKKDDSASYGDRTEWARMYPEFNAYIDPMADPSDDSFPSTFLLTYYTGPYDPKNPGAFEFKLVSENLGSPLVFNAEQLRKWRDEYGIRKLKVHMDVFSFVDGGSVMEGKNKNVLSINSSGELEVREELAGVKTYTTWIERTLLATGDFTVGLQK